MTDIVQRLRLIDPNQVLLAPPPHDTSYLQAGLICHEAAAEIERLRVEVLAEREACAKLCDDLGDGFPLGSDELHITKSLARDIRARSKT